MSSPAPSRSRPYAGAASLRSLTTGPGRARLRSTKTWRAPNFARRARSAPGCGARSCTRSCTRRRKSAGAGRAVAGKGRRNAAAIQPSPQTPPGKQGRRSARSKGASAAPESSARTRCGRSWAPCSTSRSSSTRSPSSRSRSARHRISPVAECAILSRPAGPFSKPARSRRVHPMGAAHAAGTSRKPGIGSPSPPPRSPAGRAAQRQPAGTAPAKVMVPARELRPGGTRR